MRLDKVVANNTSYSRKEINKIIKNGLVKVNGVVVKKPEYKINENDQIFLNNKIISIQKFYCVLNKPTNFICSNNNKDGESVLNLINENYLKDLHIVGRLDKNTTGLILITNDGDFTHEIKNPKNKIEKEYEVELENEFTRDMQNKLLQNKIILDGKKLKPFHIFNIHKNKLNIVIIEGKYHQIKRMFEIVNNHVINLKRIRIGKLNLNDLNIKEGFYKIVKKEEIY